VEGFRQIRWNFTDPPQIEKGGTFSEDNIRMLLCTRYLATDLDANDISPPEVNVRIVDVKADGRVAKLAVEVRAMDDHALRAALFYAVQQDSAVGGRWLTGKQQFFTQELAVERPKTNEVQIEVTVADSGGNYTKRVASAIVG
jgi:hypothetical protein